jgi:hypothetical protein
VAAAVRRITVSQPEQMQLQITQLVSQGFTVANQTNRSVTLVKRKQFSIPLSLIGLLLCVLPLFIYLIVYAMQSDQIIEIHLVESAAPQPYRASEHLPMEDDGRPAVGAAPLLQLSPDRQSWWDGVSWRPTATSYPPNAALHPDGSSWWDGESWRPLPARGTQPDFGG